MIAASNKYSIDLQIYKAHLKTTDVESKVLYKKYTTEFKQIKRINKTKEKTTVAYSLLPEVS